MAEYVGAGAAAIGLSQPSRDCNTSEEDDEEIPRSATGSSGRGRGGARQDTATPGSGSGVGPTPGSTALTVRKPRGRPPGSKNKPKPAVVITKESESAMHPLVLELTAGSDVLESVAAFASRRRIGVSVLSGSGPVANVTLRHPTSHNSTLTLHGRLEILSLSGTFLPSTSADVSTLYSCTSKSPFTISLAGSQGQVIGGTVAGTLTAAGPVVLVAASFAKPEFHRLPAPGEEGETQDTKPLAAVEPSSSPMPLAYSGATGSNSISMQVPPEVLPWGPVSRPPPPPHQHHHHRY